MKLLSNDGIIHVQQELLSLKKRLEDCKPEDLRDLQTQIRVYRSLLSADKVEELQEEIEDLGL
jgi:hypothetical protein